MMSKLFKQLCILSVLVFSFLLLSAFKQKSLPEDFSITRYEFALLVEDILNSAFDRKKIYEANNFSDLTAKENDKVLLVSKLGIISGYPDGTFRPGEKLRNIETINYMQRLAKLLVSSDPELYASKQLMRLFAYNLSLKPGDPVPKGVFPQNLLDGGAYSNKTSVCNIFEILRHGNSSNGDKNIEGIFVDSVSGYPIRNAFAAINGVALAADENGKFCVSVEADDCLIDLFAAAEGYETIDTKKDITFDRNLILKMCRKSQ